MDAVINTYIASQVSFNDRSPITSPMNTTVCSGMKINKVLKQIIFNINLLREGGGAKNAKLRTLTVCI